MTLSSHIQTVDCGTSTADTGIKKQEIPVVMTGISLLPFYSADATTMLARALLILQR